MFEGFTLEYVDVGEVTLRVRHGGDGQPVVLLHGHPRTHTTWHPDDVARYIGMTADCIYREVRAGRMPHIRLGRYVRFRRESIDAWLVARERGPAAVRTRSR